MGRNSLCEESKIIYKQNYYKQYYQRNKEKILTQQQNKRRLSQILDLDAILDNALNISKKLYNKSMIKFFREYMRTNSEYLYFKYRKRIVRDPDSYYTNPMTIKIESKKIYLNWD